MEVLNIELNTQESYVVAVSGGVDSMVLLDLVRRSQKPDNFVVAHFIHNVRSDAESIADIEVIKNYCIRYSLKLEIGEYEGKLTSEDALRKARYAFLENILKQYNYNYVITAHHKDDVLETAIINILRGTKGRGLHSLQNYPKLLRPLLEYSKQGILNYAQDNQIDWHEDSTNADENYLRNYVRINIIPILKSGGGYEDFFELIKKSSDMEDEIRQLLTIIDDMVLNPGARSQAVLRRLEFILLPHIVSRRVMRDYLEQYGREVTLTSKLIEKCVVFCKVAKVGALMDVSKKTRIKIGHDVIEFLNI